MIALTIFNLRLPSGIRGGGGILAGAVVCSVFGVRLLFKGMRDDILDESGIAKAPRWLYLASGVALQIPALIYVYAIKVAD
jgi:hypothetical protein